MYISVRDRPGDDMGSERGRRVTRRVSATVLLLGLVSLLTDVSSEMVAAILPLYLTTQVGIGYFAYGFIDGTYQGVSALVRMAGGYAGDRSNRPKWIATMGYGVSALSRIAMLPAHGFAAIAAVITADRLGKGLRTAPRDAIIAAVSAPGMLGRAFGVHRMLDTVGAVAGPLVAFALLAAVPGGYDAIFVVSFAFAAVGVAIIVLFVPDRRARTDVVRIGVVQVLREVARPRLRRPLIACALLAMVTVADGFLYLSLHERNAIASHLFPLLYVGTNVTYLVLAVPLGRLADRIGRARVLVGGHVALLGVYLVASGPLPGVASTMVSLLLLGVFYAATDGVLPALVSRLIAAEARGSGIAAAQTVVVLGRFVSSVAFGSLWMLIGPTQALMLLAVLLGAALPVAAWLLRAADDRSGDHRTEVSAP